MDLEISRHDWGALQGVSGNAQFLGAALRELGAAEDHRDAELAAQRINRVIFANGLLCSAAPAVAINLVHLLWETTEQSEDLILGILSDIAASDVDHDDPEVYGRVSREESLFEICLGFPAYVEILERSRNIDSLTACVDLILCCGLFDRRLKERSIYFLQRALTIDRLAERREVITASIEELLQSE